MTLVALDTIIVLAYLLAQGLCRHFCASYLQTCQPVVAGWSVPGTVQVDQSAANTEEGRTQ